MNDNNSHAKIHIGIVGNRPDLTDEEFDRIIINHMLSWCCFNEYNAIDVKAFRDEVGALMKSTNVDSHSILKFYNSLEDDCKEEILKKCALKEERQAPTFFDIKDKVKALEDSIDNYVPINCYNKYDNWSDSYLKRNIKRSKNPLEVKSLQRELSSRNCMSGKHRRGRYGKR